MKKIILITLITLYTITLQTEYLDGSKFQIIKHVAYSNSELHVALMKMEYAVQI